MRRAIVNIKKSRGRPRVDATAIGLRVPPEQLVRLDAWIARQPGPKPTRPEAIRRLIEAGLNATENSSVASDTGTDPAGSDKPARAKPAARARKPPSGQSGHTDQTEKSSVNSRSTASGQIVRPGAKPVAPSSKLDQIRALREQGAR